MVEKLDGPFDPPAVSGDVVYLDDDEQPVDEGESTHAVIREFDADGNMVNRTVVRREGS